MAKKYFFHNIYGDAQNLIDTAPEDVICIPAGWSPEAETNRNNWRRSRISLYSVLGKRKRSDFYSR